MKFLTFVPMLLAATPSLHAFPIVERQTSSTSNELEDGKCGKVVFIFARGSTEIGNMVSISNADSQTSADTPCRAAPSAHPPAGPLRKNTATTK